jgi:membrane associated rhomboid family serine protease
MTTQAPPTCYRHPGRETRVSCSSCGRPICPDCMTPSPVGMRCPECSRQKTKVTSMPAVSARADAATATIVLIAVNVLLFLATGTGSQANALFRRLELFGPAVSILHEYYRLVSYGFLHAGWLHIGFNMYLLWILGQMLEPHLGIPRYLTLYFTAMLGGAFGALLFDPSTPTVGASGAIFGLMGAAAVELHRRGFNPLRTDIGMLIILNLGLSFVISGISIGGHGGGLVFGVLAGIAFRIADDRRLPAIGYFGCLVLSAAAVFGAISVA